MRAFTLNGASEFRGVHFFYIKFTFHLKVFVWFLKKERIFFQKEIEVHKRNEFKKKNRICIDLCSKLVANVEQKKSKV